MSSECSVLQLRMNPSRCQYCVGPPLSLIDCHLFYMTPTPINQQFCFQRRNHSARMQDPIKERRACQRRRSTEASETSWLGTVNEMHRNTSKIYAKQVATVGSNQIHGCFDKTAILLFCQQLDKPLRQQYAQKHNEKNK